MAVSPCAEARSEVEHLAEQALGLALLVRAAVLVVLDVVAVVVPVVVLVLAGERLMSVRR